MEVEIIVKKMYFLRVFSFFLVLIALAQCQRATTTDDDPWIWSDSFSSTKRPNSVPTTQSTESTTRNRKNQPTPRICPGCFRTPQFNPVCGSDMATYDNPSAVTCANMCGPKIEILFYAACQPTA